MSDPKEIIVCPICGHACCDDETNLLHGHFLDPGDCQQCVRARREATR